MIDEVQQVLVSEKVRKEDSLVKLLFYLSHRKASKLFDATQVR